MKRSKPVILPEKHIQKLVQQESIDTLKIEIRSLRQQNKDLATSLQLQKGIIEKLGATPDGGKSKLHLNC